MNKQCETCAYNTTGCVALREGSGDDGACEDWAPQSDLATLERLLRCKCGGWIEYEWYDGFLAYCGKCSESTHGHPTPALAILAYHEEHGK